MNKQNSFSFIEDIVIKSLRQVFVREKSEHISKDNHLAKSFIYSIDEIVSKDNRLIGATIEVPTGEKEHEQ